MTTGKGSVVPVLSPPITMQTDSPPPTDDTRASGAHFRPAPFTPQKGRALRQYMRVQQFQTRWESIKADLPPQLTRSHSKCPTHSYGQMIESSAPLVGMISIGLSWIDVQTYSLSLHT